MSRSSTGGRRHSQHNRGRQVREFDDGRFLGFCANAFGMSVYEAPNYSDVRRLSVDARRIDAAMHPVSHSAAATLTDARTTCILS